MFVHETSALKFAVLSSLWKANISFLFVRYSEPHWYQMIQIFTVVVRPLSRRLLKPNFHAKKFSLSHRSSTTISLEIRNLFTVLISFVKGNQWMRHLHTFSFAGTSRSLHMKQESRVSVVVVQKQISRIFRQFRQIHGSVNIWVFKRKFPFNEEIAV